MSRRLLLALVAVACVASATGCESARRPSGTAAPPEGTAPRRRTAGPRWIPFAGGDVVAKGWTKVDDLLWVESRDVEAFRRGLLRAGERWVPIEEADAALSSPEEGYLLRTDHFTLRTNVAFARAKDLARLVEEHARLVLEAFGEALDLRFPEDPIPVVVARRRAEYERLLAARVPAAVEWGAFYWAADGTVYASDETRQKGGLDVVADVRHETTHAILDLGRAEAPGTGNGRARMFGRPQFWAWEAAAIWSEGLGDPPSARRGAERFERFRRRLSWGEVVPLAELLALPQSRLEGRHYDQIASLVRWLMEEEGLRHRAGFLSLLGRVMDGWGEPDDFHRFVGISPDEAQARWLSWAETTR